jgi:hypothetical protein
MAAIFMSGYPSRAAREIGAHDLFLAKPFSVPDLLYAVATVLQAREREETA